MTLFLIALTFLAHTTRFEQNLELGEEDVIPDYSNDEGRKKKIKCKNPNTKRSFKNKCICVDGYLGDPDSTHGCFRCESECSERAKCLFPGNCVCTKGFIGNNNSICSEPTPYLESIEEHSQFYLKIRYRLESSDFKPFYVVCKFGNINSSAMLNEDNSISCFIPKNFKTNNNNIVISFNGKNWSNSLNYVLNDVDHKFFYSKNDTKLRHSFSIHITNIQFFGISIGIALVSIVFACF